MHLPAMLLARIKGFATEIYLKRSVLYELSKRDFQQQYMGSYLGLIWVFLQPLLFILILYAVFSLGFRKGAVATGMPFSVYLISGMIAWMYFSNILMVTTGVIRGHKFLVTRGGFRLSILPIVKILSSLIPHVFFIFLAVGICWVNGYAPSFYTLQVGYYLVAMITLLLGVSWITSSTSLFVSDVTKVVGVLVQFGFWLTPIFWDIQMVPRAYQWIFQINPACYLVTGYRESLVLHIPFWHHPVATLYYWACTLLILFVGITLFGKLRHHFAEVV